MPLWTDELFTRSYPQAGLAYLWGEGLRTEPTSPLYYTLIAAVERVAGSGPWALRLPSVVGSLASVWLAWRLGRELFEERGAAALGALLLALAPIDVFYAQEARSYALQGAALGLALLGFARLLRGGSGMLAYAAGAALAVWLHPTSVAAVAAFNVAAVVALVLPGRVLPFWRWVAGNVAVVAACAPLFPSILSPPAGGVATGWIPALNRWSLESVIGQTLAGPALADQSQRIAELALPALLLLALIPLWRPGRRALLVLVLVPAATLAIMIGVSAVKPVLLSRTLAWLLLPLAVALGGILSRRSRVLAGAGVAVVAACAALQAVRAPALKENWPALFAQMGDVGPPALVVLAPHSPPGAVALYAGGRPAPVRLDDGGPPVPETAVIPRLLGTPTITRDELQAALAADRPVWLIYRRPEYEWAQREIAGLPPPTARVQSEPGPNPALRALFWHGGAP